MGNNTSLGPIVVDRCAYSDGVTDCEWWQTTHAMVPVKLCLSFTLRSPPSLHHLSPARADALGRLRQTGAERPTHQNLRWCCTSCFHRRRPEGEKGQVWVRLIKAPFRLSNGTLYCSVSLWAVGIGDAVNKAIVGTELAELLRSELTAAIRRQQIWYAVSCEQTLQPLNHGFAGQTGQFLNFYKFTHQINGNQVIVAMVTYLSRYETTVAPA